MNKYIRALKEIEAIYEKNIFSQNPIISDCVQVLSELVKKAELKKPIVHGLRAGREVNTISFTCPSCDNHIDVGNYCKHCGQALDWREWGIDDE